MKDDVWKKLYEDGLPKQLANITRRSQSLARDFVRVKCAIEGHWIEPDGQLKCTCGKAQTFITHG